MKLVRFGTFETNSSSTHSITMCSEDTYNKWKDGKVFYNACQRKFYPVDKVSFEGNKIDEETKWWVDVYNIPITYDMYFNLFGDSFETYENHYTSENGDKIVAFGYYGYT